MNGFHVLGVTQVNDSYPNVKYKLLAMRQLLGDAYNEYVVPIDKSGNSGSLFSALRSNRLMLGLRLLVGHIKIVVRTLKYRATSVYVCYPGIAIAVWLSLPFVRGRYPVVYLDAFISLYDTVVLDRRLLNEGGLLARFLYRLERRAFATATSVVVDTPENAQHYARLFRLPPKKFCVIPLCIPPMETTSPAQRERERSALRCLFVGTFVPLQGIPTIVAAMKILADDSDIEFVFVGDGQDARYLDEYVAAANDARVTWHRGHYPTPFVIDQISTADVCLGIFDDGPKAQRVLPYKVYYYLALGRPTVTAATASSQRISAECEDASMPPPLQLVPPGNPEALALKLRGLRDNRDELARTGSAGRDYFDRALSDPAIMKSLQELITVA